MPRGARTPVKKRFCLNSCPPRAYTLPFSSLRKLTTRQSRRWRRSLFVHFGREAKLEGGLLVWSANLCLPRNKKESKSTGRGLKGYRLRGLQPVAASRPHAVFEVGARGVVGLAVSLIVSPRPKVPLGFVRSGFCGASARRVALSPLAAFAEVFQSTLLSRSFRSGTCFF